MLLVLRLTPFRPAVNFASIRATRNHVHHVLINVPTDGSSSVHKVAKSTLPSHVRRFLLNGDTSQWDRALKMPHYTVKEMPAVSFETACHLVQWAKTGEFRLFDHGSRSANRCAAGLTHQMPGPGLLQVVSLYAPVFP